MRRLASRSSATCETRLVASIGARPIVPVLITFDANHRGISLTSLAASFHRLACRSTPAPSGRPRAGVGKSCRGGNFLPGGRRVEPRGREDKYLLFLEVPSGMRLATLLAVKAAMRPAPVVGRQGLETSLWASSTRSCHRTSGTIRRAAERVGQHRQFADHGLQRDRHQLRGSGDRRVTESAGGRKRDDEFAGDQ
jgi:hypothetical protein